MKFSGPINLRNWSFFDVAHSAFAVGIVSFIFPVYFTNAVIGDGVKGASLWSFYIGLSGFFVAILSPIIGMVVDKYGHIMTWLRCLTGLLIVSTACLWFIKPVPETSGLFVAAFLIILANTAYELVGSVSNTLLPSVTSQAKMGRASNIAWGAGYVGGVFALIFSMILFIGIAGWKGLMQISFIDAQHIRASFIFIALWIFMFSLPFLLSKTKALPVSPQGSFDLLKTSFKKVWDDRNLRLFMIGSAIYRDGLATLFAVGALYAGVVYKLDASQILVFGIWLNVMAGLGALLLARYDDKFGSRILILVCLCGLIAVGTEILFITHSKTFLYFALGLGIFIGPAQAAGRTMLARLVPDHEMGRMFGIYSLTGRSISFLGPMIFSAVTALTEQLQAGMISIIAFWFIGAIFIFFTKDNHVRHRSAISKL